MIVDIDKIQEPVMDIIKIGNFSVKEDANGNIKVIAKGFKIHGRKASVGLAKLLIRVNKVVEQAVELGKKQCQKSQ